MTIEGVKKALYGCAIKHGYCDQCEYMKRENMFSPSCMNILMQDALKAIDELEHKGDKTDERD